MPIRAGSVTHDNAIKRGTAGEARPNKQAFAAAAQAGRSGNSAVQGRAVGRVAGQSAEARN